MNFRSPNQGIILLKGSYRRPWPFQIGQGRCQSILWKYWKTLGDMYVLIVGAFGWNLTASLPLGMSLSVESTWRTKWVLDGSVGCCRHINQTSIICFTVLFTTSLKKPSASRPIVHPSHRGWCRVSSQGVYIVGSQGLEPYPPVYISLCFPSHSPISQHVSHSRFLWGTLEKAREFRGSQSLGHNLFRLLQSSCLFCPLISFAVPLAHKRALPLAPTVDYGCLGRDLHCFSKSQNQIFMFYGRIASS